MGELCISDCFGMADVGVSAGAILHEIEEMGFAFGSGKEEEMSDFWEESYNLNTFLLTANPRKNFFLREIAILNR